MPPSIKCPRDIVAETERSQDYAYVNWTTPEVIDNADPSPISWTKPHVVLPWKAKIGTRIVVYVAQDASGNKARCKFKVKVVDREPPMIENCVDPPTFYTDLDSGLDNVTWDEPVFYDNSRGAVQVNQSHQPGDNVLPIGRTRVYYNATDKYNNRAICVLNITVEDVCKNLTTSAVESIERFNVVNDELLLKCNSSGRIWEYNDLPEYSETETQIPKTISQEGNVILQGDGSAICDNQTALHELSNIIANDLKSRLLDICGNDIECNMVNFDPECKDDLSSSKSLENNLIRRRRRYPGSHIRSLGSQMTIIKRLIRATRGNPESSRNKANPKRRRDKIEIKFKFIGRIIEENFENPRRGMEKLREKIDAMARMGKLDLLDNRTNQEIAKLALNLHLVFKAPQALCDSGSVLKKYSCVKCSAGTFYNSSSGVCQPCPFGQYQDATAALECKPCPERTFTKRMHAKSLKDCIPVCRPGYYSRRKRYHGSRLALEPCVACDFGFYQPSYGQTQCAPCPANTTTENRGSADAGDCAPVREVDDCRTDPCLNAGRCVQDESDFVCECQDYYVGSKCEELRDPCASSPCLNEGTCRTQRRPDNGSVSYECACKSSYTGANCEIYVDECFTHPCQNNGKCVSTESDFACECNDGFEGQFCEISMDHCELMPCEEGSACRTANGTWQCHCKPGFLGRHCSLLPCDWLPCHANAICANIREENATRNSYRCECPKGYAGADCTIKIDHCESSPCSNNGNCINHVGNYTCECHVPFAGRNCETELSSDYVMHFARSGTTDYVLMRGSAHDLSQLSVCLWLQSMDTSNYGTVLSYATTFHDNAFTLTDYNGLVLYVNGEKIVTDVKVNDGYWHFLCVTWESQYGSWRVFVDGALQDSGFRLARETVVRANGSLVIGQEQDRPGGGFSESEAFLGKLGMLDVWSVVLDEGNVTALWSGCERYHGNLVAWAQMRQHVHGDVAILASPFCRGCPLPVVPTRGNINVSEDQSEVTYYCDNGYVIEIGGEERRSFRRKCLKHGQWEGYDTPSCTKIRCGFPGYFPRGQIHGELYSFGDEIHYSCAEGYELRGNPHRICNSEGKWTGLPPVCIGTTCRNLLAPENGDIEYILEENERDDLTILQAGQQLEFKCDPGYRLVGERYLTCLDTGVWDHDRPSCAPYGCPPPKEIEHGHLVPSPDKSNGTSAYDPEENSVSESPSGGVYRHGIVVGVSCHRGYKFRGSHDLSATFELRCSVNGTWTGAVPECVPRSCRRPDRARNARLLFRKRDGATAEIHAENERSNRASNESEATVEAAPEAFAPGAEIVVVCDPGYEPDGDEVLTCTEEESWSPAGPVSCVPRNCSVSDHPVFALLERPENETVEIVPGSDTVSPRLDEEYGAGNITVAYKNLEIFVEGTGYGQDVVLSCRNNTRMNLDRLLSNETILNITWTCSDAAKWEGANLLLNESSLALLLNDSTYICDGSCAPPQAPEYGYFDSGNNTDGGRSAIDSVVVFKCRHGYVLEGGERSVCLPNATWSALPSCKPITCGSPPILVNAMLKADTDAKQNFTFGNMISYQCAPGYRVFGQASLICLGSGKWSRPAGRCSKISCGKPQIQSGVKLHGRSYLFQDQLTYVCPDGKKQGMITCQADGKWSEMPRCNGK